MTKTTNKKRAYKRRDTNKESVRPTKKQKELLEFIEEFIIEHGYSPSYREVMSGLSYTSVATVALHINSLIKRGHLMKRDRSARSLEVVKSSQKAEEGVKDIEEHQAKWLMAQIESRFYEIEASETKDPGDLDRLFVLVGALKILGLGEAANSFIPRLGELKNEMG